VGVERGGQRRGTEDRTVEIARLGRRSRRIAAHARDGEAAAVGSSLESHARDGEAAASALELRTRDGEAAAVGSSLESRARDGEAARWREILGA
jgi:hypothetical protein